MSECAGGTQQASPASHEEATARQLPDVVDHPVSIVIRLQKAKPKAMIRRRLPMSASHATGMPKMA